VKIKCPICQDSIAITLTWEDTDNYSTIQTREYECECGCVFTVNFVAEKPKILQIPIDKSQIM
jgi:hypothetical protein